MQIAARLADKWWAGRPAPTRRLPRYREEYQHTMIVRFAALPTLEALRQHVLQMLCSHDNLDPNQTPLRQALVTRAGKPCGLFFQVQGPRLLKTYAVWAGEEDRILFYDSTGVRYAETRLSEGPDPQALAA